VATRSNVSERPMRYCRRAMSGQTKPSSIDIYHDIYNTVRTAERAKLDT